LPRETDEFTKPHTPLATRRICQGASSISVDEVGICNYLTRYSFLQANFVSLEALVERIHKDGQIAKAALDMTPYSQYAEDPYLTTLLPNSAT
jgi:hypothetical protein